MYKIAIIHPSAGVNWNGNSELFAIELAHRLDNYFEVELLCGGECGSFSRPIKSITRTSTHSFIYRCLNGWFERPEIALEHLTSFFPCIIHLLNNPVDLICPQNGYGGLFVAYCVRAIKGTPILFTEHNSPLDRSAYIKRNLLLQPNRTIAPNPLVAEYIEQIAPKLSLDAIPYGVDLTEFTPQGTRIKTGLVKPIVLCVSPLTRNGDRGLELTINAVARLSQASLLICGDGADRDYYQALGDRLLGSARFQIKPFNHAQMPQVYRSVDLFTLASAQEHHGLVYLKAIASGLPVVTTDDPLRRYFVGDGGITCDVNNLDSYAESLQLALERDWYPNHLFEFSWQKTTLLYRQAAIQTIYRANSNLLTA